jgi:DNA polymerase-3 subunit epsilon
MTDWPDVRIADAVWVCADCETTGLEVGEGHRVCELATVKGTWAGPVQEFASLVNPERPLDPSAARVSGLSDAEVSAAPPFVQLAPEAHAFLSGAVIVAHNAPFDVGFLESEFARAGLRLPQAPIVDTTVIAQSVLGLPMRNLAGVSQALGLASQPSHRALDDARATREVLLHGLRRLAAEGAGSVGDVIEALIPPAPPVLPLLDDPLPAIREALVRGADLCIAYLGRSGPGERTIRPIRLEERNGALMLAAFCRERLAPRNFRVDRIASAQLILA